MAHRNSNRVEFTIVPDLPPGVEATQEARDLIAAEVAKWSKDPKYVPVIPFAVKIVSDKTFPPAPYELPPGNGEGVRIVSNGTPQGTLVMDKDGKMLGPIWGLELLPISCEDNHALRCRITMPVSYLDISAAEETPRSFDRVMNLLDHVFASEKIPDHRKLTNKLLRILRSECFTLWPPAAAEQPDYGAPKYTQESKSIDVDGCSACGESHKGLRRYAFEQPGPKVFEGVHATHWAHCPKTDMLVFLADAPERKGLTPDGAAVSSGPAR